jgi:hypothetical protein
MPPPNAKKKASQVFDESWSDSDWSESEKDKSQAKSPPRPRTTEVRVVRDDISVLLDTFVKHGIAVKGEVSKTGDISFVFRSAPGKLVPVALDRPMLPANQQEKDNHGRDDVPKAHFKEEGCKHHHHHHRGGHTTRRRSRKHGGGFFRGWS